MTELKTPKESKGGTFSPADIKLIKKVLIAHIGNTNIVLTDEEKSQSVSLIHRLGRIG